MSDLQEDILDRLANQVKEQVDSNLFINMAKTIKISYEEWKNIKATLEEEYQHKPSVLMIRTVMRRELGFTTREQWDWYTDERDNPGIKHFMCLDFYDDVQETFFRLKYL